MRFLSRDVLRKYQREIGTMSKPKATIYYDTGPRDDRSAAEIIVWALGHFDQAAVIFLFSIGGDGWTELQMSNPRWQRYRRWRQSLGETRPLYDSPVHIAEKEEAAELELVIEFALILGWDAIITAEPGRDRLFLSHDDRLEIYRCAKWRGLEKRLTRLSYWHAKQE